VVNGSALNPVADAVLRLTFLLFSQWLYRYYTICRILYEKNYLHLRAFCASSSCAVSRCCNRNWPKAKVETAAAVLGCRRLRIEQKAKNAYKLKLYYRCKYFVDYTYPLEEYLICERIVFFFFLSVIFNFKFNFNSRD